MHIRAATTVLIAVAALALPAFGRQAAGSSLAPDGIAISTHRPGGVDGGFGVAPQIFGDLVRHDIQAGRVVKRTLLYQGRARGARINYTGDKVAFLKLGGHVCVINMDGTGFRELTNTRNSNASAIDWPAGDWVYYSEEGASPDGVFNAREKDDTLEKRTLRRVNVLTGEDELAGMAPRKIWQLSMAATTTKNAGRFAITGVLLDFADPATPLNDRNLACGTAVSMNGLYVTESTDSHADLKIWDWELRTLLRHFHVNEWAAQPDDGRKFFYRPRWAVNSDRWIIMTHGMDFGSTLQSNMALYNWRDGAQILVTDNPLTSTAADEGEDFWLAHMASDLADRPLEGKAPFTVELASDKLAGREWVWDFDDGGATATAAIGHHTYAEPGHYTITARHGDTVLRQAVTVLERRAPGAAVRVLDSRHLLLEFDEPMNLDAAAVALASRTPVAALTPGPLSRDLLVSLDADLPRRDTVSITGVYDLAQAPNPPAQSTFAVTQPPWPANRNDLVFLWQTRDRHSFYRDPARAMFDPVRMNTVDRARFDRFGVMLLEGGVAFATDAGRCIADTCRDAAEFSIEAVITPANIFQGRPGNPRRILGCTREGNPGFTFSLDQEADRLSFALVLKGEGGVKVHRVPLGPLEPDVPHHVVVSYRPGLLRGWLHGRIVHEAQASGEISWNRPAYTDGLHFGGHQRAGLRWRGRIEGVAIYATADVDAQAGWAAYAALLESRPQVDRVRLVGRLSEKAEVPGLDEISPYRDALVVYEYGVVRLHAGTYGEDEVRVAHWGLRDGSATPVAALPIGTEVELTLEPFSDHPQLEGHVLREPTLNFILPLFADVANGPTGEPRAATLNVHPREVWMPVGMPVRYVPQALDQYDEKIDVPITWSAKPGGSINVGTAYGAGQHFAQARQPGEGTISQDGLFTGTKAGTVTITLSSDTDPAITATAIAGVGDYPAVYPASKLPLCIGNERDGFIGDIDRLRLYGRVMADEEVAANAAGRKPRDEGLIADWTFDERKGGAYANVAGEGLAARVVGDVEHVEDKDGRYVRLARKGWLEVAPDPRLDASAALTIEAWVRPAGPGSLIFRQVVWQWGLTLWVDPNSVMVDAFRTDGSPLRAEFKFPQESWTHLVVAVGPSGAWNIYANGKLIGAREAMPAPVR